MGARSSLATTHRFCSLNRPRVGSVGRQNGQMTSLSTPRAQAKPLAQASIARPLLAFLPYVVVSIAHLIFQFLDLELAASLSKWLLMPALAMAVMLATPTRRSFSTAILVTAITLSWLGDITPLYASDVFFVVGLSFFLLSHLAYLTAFTRGFGYTRPRPWALVYVVWWLGFVLLLGPSLGGLLVPVALYGAVLGAMAAYASRGTATVALGGALFLVSDTLLGTNKFLSGFELWESGFVIMLTYLGAQGLIAWGLVALQRRRLVVAAQAAPSAARA